MMTFETMDVHVDGHHETKLIAINRLGAVVGHLALKHWPENPEWKSAAQLFVTETHRRQGVGSGLVSKMLDCLKKQNFAGELAIGVMPDNLPGLSFWKAWGFIPGEFDEHGSLIFTMRFPL